MIDQHQDQDAANQEQAESGCEAGQDQQSQQPQQDDPKGGPPKPPPSAKEVLGAMAYNLALAEAMKPIEAQALAVHGWSPEQIAARVKLAQDYAEALKKDSALDKRIEKAGKDFNRNANDMEKDGHLNEWLKLLEGKEKLAELLERRQATKTAANDLASPKLRKLNEAREQSNRWAEHFADWSAPVAKISALLDAYADKLDELNSDVNNDKKRELAMATFWFEVAPKHLQLLEAYDTESKAVVEKVLAKLTAYEDLTRGLTAGGARNDGCLFVIAADSFEAKRADVLAKWTTAATKLAGAEADWKLEQEANAALQGRWDKLKDDGWLAEAKQLLEPPAA